MTAPPPLTSRLWEHLYRLHPSSHPCLKGKVLLGTVLPSKASDKFVDLDVGFKAHVTLPRSDLGALGASAKPGDRFPVVAEHLETPLGEMQLSGERARDQERLERVWEEICSAKDNRRTVKARAPPFSPSPSPLALFLCLSLHRHLRSAARV